MHSIAQQWIDGVLLASASGLGPDDEASGGATGQVHSRLFH